MNEIHPMKIWRAVAPCWALAMALSLSGSAAPQGTVEDDGAVEKDSSGFSFQVLHHKDKVPVPRANIELTRIDGLPFKSLVTNDLGRVAVVVPVVAALDVKVTASGYADYTARLAPGKKDTSQNVRILMRKLRVEPAGVDGARHAGSLKKAGSSDSRSTHLAPFGVEPTSTPSPLVTGHPASAAATPPVTTPGSVETVELLVDGARPAGPLPEALNPGFIANSWTRPTLPVAQELERLGKPITWRFGCDLAQENPFAGQRGEADWSAFDRQTRESCETIRKNFAGRIVLSIDHVPRWLSAHPEDDRLFGDGDFRRADFSPPRDYGKWAVLVGRTVAIQKACGMEAEYIIGDEPDWMFYGTEDEFFQMYSAAAKAIKAVDPAIRVGALGVSNWDGKRRLVPGYAEDYCPYDHSMLQGFIEYVGKHSDVPVDFIDWHFSDPWQVEMQVAQTRAWIKANWPEAKQRAVDFTIGEGVYSQKKDYEAREQAASFLVAQHVSFARAGIRRYTATSLLDQHGWTSGDWQHVGFFSDCTGRVEGIVKPKWNALKLLSKLDGHQLPVEVRGSQDTWLYAAACRKDGRTDVLVAYHPEWTWEGIMDRLLKRGYSRQELDATLRPIIKRVRTSMEDLIQQSRYDQARNLTLFVIKSADLSDGLRRDLEASAGEEFADFESRFGPRKLAIHIAHPGQGKKWIREYLVDAAHSNSYRYNQRTGGAVDRTVRESLEGAERSVIAAAATVLRERGGYSDRQASLLAEELARLWALPGPPEDTARRIRAGMLAFVKARARDLAAPARHAASPRNLRELAQAALQAFRACLSTVLEEDFYPRMDRLNREKGITLEMVQEKEITVSDAGYEEDLVLDPYSVVLLELSD